MLDHPASDLVAELLRATLMDHPTPADRRFEDTHDDDEPPHVVVPGFEAAWQHLGRARTQRGRLRDAWHQIGGDYGFDPVLNIDDDGSGRVGVTVTWPPGALEEANAAALEFATAIKATFDAALTAAARAVSGDDTAELPMPLLDSQAKLDEWITEAASGLVRPDQVSAVAEFQPFYGADAPDGHAHHILHVVITQLASMLDPDRDDRPRVAVWVHSAKPYIELIDGNRIACEPTGDGLMRNQLTVGTFPAPESRPVGANPDCAFDPIFDDEPYPTDGDDTLNLRTRMFVAIAAEFTRGMQRSTTDGYYHGLPDWLDRRSVQDTGSGWGPLDPADENYDRIQELFGEGDASAAAYYDPDGNLTMLLRVGDTVYGRPLSNPLPLPPHTEPERGIAVEEASLGAAAMWGMPDFVMRGKTRAKGNSSREVGDGTIITGTRGLTLQAKARDGDLGDLTRQENWVNKMVKRGASQARGTVRSLRADPAELANHRGRPVTCDGTSIEWVGVVIIDHPDPPDIVPTIPACGDLPIVVLTRRDWDFLFHQLRSVTAVVDYLHRVAGDDPQRLGTEPLRYFDLAQADEDATSTPAPWTSAHDAVPYSHPLLPKQPVSVDDNVGHHLLRAVFETIATIRIESTEAIRLEMLTLLDRLPVAARPAMGRLVLDHLTAVAQHSIGSLGWRFRRVIQDRGKLQLVFGAGFGEMDMLREVLYQRTLCWHEDMIERTGIESVVEVSTVAVMVSPRYDGTRPWDTTTVFLKGPTGMNPTELEELREFWARTSSDNGPTL